MTLSIPEFPSSILTPDAPGPPRDDIATYLRQNRSKQKAARRANPKRSADKYQAATLAQQEALRAREKLEERERLRREVGEKLASSVNPSHSLRNLDASPVPKVLKEGSEEVDSRERRVGEEGEMHPSGINNRNWLNENLRMDMSETSADAEAMEVEEGNGSLFCPMEDVSTHLSTPSAQRFRPNQQSQLGHPSQQGQSTNSGHPNQQGQITQPGQVAPMAPMQRTTRRSIDPGQTPRHFSVQRDDNRQRDDMSRQRYDHARNPDVMRDDTPLGRSPSAKFNQPNQSIQTGQTIQPNQQFQTNQSYQDNQPEQTIPTQTLDLTTTSARKRKREAISTHADMSTILKSLERLDQQQTLDLASRDSEIMRLKLQLSDLRSLTTTHETASSHMSRRGETMAQQTASLRTQVSELRRFKVDAEYKIHELEDSLEQKEAEIQAAEDWTADKATVEDKMCDKEAQLAQAQEQVSRFMDAFHREAALRQELVKKLESGERFNGKLAKDLKKKNEEVRRGSEDRERYIKLSGAVRGLFTYIQMETMSSDKFGDVGKALKRVRDLVFDDDERVDGGGDGK
ncbi:Aldo-keto reductase [Venturia nashicola]|nr:Aldo-keto reductase [Venturia nashicola]